MVSTNHIYDYPFPNKFIPRVSGVRTSADFGGDIIQFNIFQLKDLVTREDNHVTVEAEAGVLQL